MNKILIELYLPTALKSVDIFVPPKSTIGEVMYSIGQALPELSAGLLNISDSTVLCNKATGRIYRPEETIAESGIKEGTEVFLI